MRIRHSDADLGQTEAALSRYAVPKILGVHRQVRSHGRSGGSGEANRIIVVTGCAGPTSLEAITPDIVLVPKYNVT